MGGDEPDVPDPPDYSEIEDMLTESYGFSFDKAKEMFEWASKAYEDNKFTSDLFTDKALGEMDKNIADADRYRERYQAIYEPLEEQLAAEAQSYGSTERQEYEAGKAEADVAMQFEQARDTAQQRLEAYGVDPSQTRTGAMDLGSRIAEAAAQSGAGNQARERAVQTGRDLRTEALGIGSRLPGQVLASSGQGVQSGVQGVNAGLATTASGAQTMGTPTQWEGLGQQAASNLGNIKNQGYANQMDAYNAQAQQSSGWGSVLGTVAGLATSFIPGLQEGGAIPEPDGQYLPPEMSPSGGAIPDDIPAEIEGQAPAQLNAGEFVMPKDVVGWLGEKGMQQLILKARKEMTGANGERPAQPEMAEPAIPM